jgi:hypothetical protein
LWASIGGGVHSLGRGLEVLVHGDEALLIELHAGRVEANVLGVERPSRANEHLFRLDLLRLATHLHVERHAALPDLGPLHRGRRQHLDLALLEAAGDCCGRLGVLQGQDLRQDLDQRDLGAEGVQDIGELAANRAGAHDGHRLGRCLQEERLVGGDHRGSVELETDLWNALHARARGDDDRLGGRVGVLADLDLSALLQRAGAGDHSHLVLLHQELDTLRVLLAHLAGVLDGRPEVE